MSMNRVLAAGVLGLFALSCTPSAPKFSFKHAERRGKLESNGLRFVLMPDETTQLVEVDVRYNVGSREDPPGKAGLAHLVEHLMFQQKPDGPTTPPLMQAINDITTFFNAYTNWDTTHYMMTARAENLDALLKIEAMRIHYGCESISKEEFEREREVVRNEIRQRNGTAEGQIPQLVMSAVYPKNHAYERMIGGDDSQLTTITLEDACKFMKEYYTPANATVIIAGGVSLDPTIDALSKWFAKLENRKTAPRRTVDPVVVEKGRKQYDLDVERPSVHIAWALPALNTPEGEAAYFGINNAFSQIASKAREYDFAYSVEPQMFGGKEAPVFAISIDLKGMSKLEEALEFTWKAANQAHRGFDEGTFEQLEEMKNMQKASFIEGLEALSNRTNKIGDMVQFSKDFDFDSQDIYMFHELDKIDKFDGERIGSVVKKVLAPEKARVVVIKPNKEGVKGDRRSSLKFETKSHDQIVVPDVDPKEAKRPIKVATELRSLTGANRFVLGNGMQVVLLPIRSMPIISAQLIFNNVGKSSTPESPALASAAADFLNLPPDAEAFAKTGVGVGCGATQDETICSTGGISLYLDVMLKGFERLIVAGDYNQERIERWQKSVRERFKTQTTQQEAEFRRQITAALYGPEHPYTRTTNVTPDAVGKISKTTLNEFRKAHYRAGNATLIIVGDFEVTRAEKLVRSTFGGWSQTTPAKRIDPTPFKRTGPIYIGVIGKEAPQLNVRIAYPAPAGVDGQEGARMVLTTMLNNRVADIRFKLGSTYGVQAGRVTQRGPSSYHVAGTVDADRAGESLKAMREFVDSLRKGERFDEDFVRARRKVISELFGTSTVTSDLADSLAFISNYGLDAKFYNSLLQQVAATPTSLVKALIQNELSPQNEVVVIMGSKAQLDKAFKEAGIKDVKLIEPEYK
jgi:zinc protease